MLTDEGHSAPHQWAGAERLSSPCCRRAPGALAAGAMAELGVISRPNCGWKSTLEMAHSHSCQLGAGCRRRDVMTTQPPACPHRVASPEGAVRERARGHSLAHLVSEVMHRRCHCSLLFIQVTPVSVRGDARG